MTIIKTRMLISVWRSGKSDFLRREFDRFGSKSAVSRALRQLVEEERLTRIGYGAYMPGRAYGMPLGREGQAVLDVLGKLGTQPSWGGRVWRDLMEGRSTQVPARPTVIVRKRVSRRLGFGGRCFWYEAPDGRIAPDAPIPSWDQGPAFERDREEILYRVAAEPTRVFARRTFVGYARNVTYRAMRALIAEGKMIRIGRDRFRAGPAVTVWDRLTGFVRTARGNDGFVREEIDWCGLPASVSGVLRALVEQGELTPLGADAYMRTPESSREYWRKREFEQVRAKRGRAPRPGPSRGSVSGGAP